ncbi:hypothetical protein [Sphingomonas ginsenosidimutans]|nr:hypothetical protein [Sphingomonas ginsenosidimutans]
MIDLDALHRIANAGHPDSALVGVPVSMIREIERRLRRRERKRA